MLTDEDIEHYQKIVVALSETIHLMAEIDEVIEAHGAGPVLFKRVMPATRLQVTLFMPRQMTTPRSLMVAEPSKAHQDRRSLLMMRKRGVLTCLSASYRMPGC